MTKLSDIQENCAKAILGWDHKLSGQAAICDLGWQHITRELMLARFSFYARIMKLLDTPGHVRMKDMLNAAAHINTGWTHHTITMFRIAISPIPPPTGHMTWQSMLPMATRNPRRLDEALRQAKLSRSLTFPLYPKQGPSANHQHALYELGMASAKCKLFGSMRAGASTFPYSTKDCPACATKPKPPPDSVAGRGYKLRPDFSSQALRWQTRA